MNYHSWQEKKDKIKELCINKKEAVVDIALSLHDSENKHNVAKSSFKCGRQRRSISMAEIPKEEDKGL